MARVKNPITVLGADGRPLAGATVTTRTRPAGVVASAFAVESGSSPADNPATTDATGRVVQWLERGAYASTVAHASIGSYVDEWEAAPAADAAVQRPWLDVSAAQLVGLYAGRPAAARDLAGVEYVATDTGTRYVCDSTPAWVLTGAWAVEVRTLPVSPVAGQEVLYRGTGAPANGWLLRYNAGSVSAYRWELLGGGAARAEDTGSGSSRSTTYATWATSPQLTVPLAGDYDVEIGAIVQQVQSNGAGAWCALARDGVVAGTPATGSALASVQTASLGGAYMASRSRQTAVTAGTVLTLRLRTSTPGETTSQFGYIAATPIRVG